MATCRDWDKIKIWGYTLVSNFSSIDCTDERYAEYTPEQLVEPGQVLAGFGPNYHRVVLDHFEDEDAYIRVDGKVYKVEPGLSVKLKLPLSYAWSETMVYVDQPSRNLDTALMEKDATEREMKNWNKVLLSVFKKSRFLHTVVVGRADLAPGYNLLKDVENWSTKVLVEEVSDEGLITDKFALTPDEKAEIEEWQTGEYSWQNGYSKMYFRLNGCTRPFLVVSVITRWMDTNFYSGFVIAPEDLDSVADISSLLDKDEREAFPDLKARYADNGTITVDFEGKPQTLDPQKRDTWSTPERETRSSTVTIYDEDHSIEHYAKIQIEAICS